MSGQVKQITLRATYESDLTGLHKDMAAIKAIRKRLEKHPISIPLSLDLSGIKSQAAKAAAEYRKALQKEMAAIKPGEGGVMSKGGVFIPASARRELENFTAASGAMFKTISNEGKKTRTEFEQIARGVQRITQISKKGKSASIIDTRPIENLKAALEGIDSAFAGKLGGTKGSKGDVAALLEQKRSEISKTLGKFAELENTPEYIRAQKSLNTLVRQIAEAQPKQAAAAEKAAKTAEKAELDDKARRLGKNLSRIDRGFSGKIGDTKGNKGDLADVLEQKRLRIAKELVKFAGIADSTAFRAGQKAIATLKGQIAEAQPKQAARAQADARAAAASSATRNINRLDRFNEKQVIANKGDYDAAKHIQNEQLRMQELNRVLGEREKILSRTRQILASREFKERKAGNDDAANKYQTAGRRIGNDADAVSLERKRVNSAYAKQNSDEALNRRLNGLMRAHKLDMQQLSTMEKVARAVSNRTKREADLNRVLQQRSLLSNNTLADLAQIRREADTRGLHSLSNRAENAGNSVQSKMISAQAPPAKKSGGGGGGMGSFLGNAGKFTQWFIPAQVVMGITEALAAGARNAVAAERTFKVLNSVFRGTREESGLLAQQTLALAAANGRSAQEAAESAVSWARLGLTRTQVLMAMETSLRAANVAEISTADATKYLTAQYKAFNQTLTDIPANLDFINSLSNKLNVTPENIMQGVARTATVAKQAGVELNELSSIIAVVSDVTGRPGEETGNAMKFIMTRIRRPQTMDAIKDEFGLDLRTPSGDAKGMMEIFQELAELYPSLNRLEKARVNDLVAGSRQTERYAVIVENFTEILGAHAQAGFDANSAARENAEILTSVDASLQQVSSSWTAFMSSLGEAGAFKFASDHLKDMATQVKMFSSFINGKETKGDAATKFIADYGHLIEKKNAGKGAHDKMKDIAMNAAGSVGGGLKISKYVQGLRAQRAYEKLDAESQRQVNSALEKDTADAGSSLLAKDFTQAKIRTKSLLTSGNAFGKMSRDMLREGIEPNKMLKQFDEYVPQAAELPGGAKNVAEARLAIRPLMESGDRKGASALLADLESRFKKEGETATSSTENLRLQNLGKINILIQKQRDELTGLNETLKVSDGEDAQKRLQTEIATTTDRLKESEETAKAMAKAMEMPELQSMSDLNQEMMGDYLDDFQRVQDSIGAAIAGFANTGVPEIDMKLRLGGNLLARDSAGALVKQMEKEHADLDEPALRSIKADDALKGAAKKEAYENVKRAEEEFRKIKSELDSETKLLAPQKQQGSHSFGTEGGGKRGEDFRDYIANNELAAAFALKEAEKALADERSKAAQIAETGGGSNEEYDKHITKLRQDIQLRGEQLAMAKEKFGLLTKETEEVERQLELQRQAERLQMAHTDSAASTSAGLASYGIGASEGERITNRTRAAITGAAAPGRATGDPLDAAREIGRITANLTEGKQGLLSIEQRMAQATAERANMEYDITENLQKQREEASKRLALASREDQLRAAAAAATLKNRGQDEFSMREFQFFSQETRGAISNFMPEKVKGLDDTERDNDRARAKLDEEVAKLAASLQPLSDAYAEAARLAGQNIGNLQPDLAPKLPSSQDVIKKENVRLNLNLGDVVMNFDFANAMSKVQDYLTGRVDARITEEFAKMRFVGPPDNRAAVSAF